MLGGEVQITLAGQPVTLVPTLGAAIRLSGIHGGFGALLGKLETYDLKASTETVLHGLGRVETEMQRTTEEVFHTGLVDLAPDLVRYVIRLANGGRPLKQEEDGPAANSPFAGSP